MLNIVLSFCGFALLLLAAVVVFSDRRSVTNRWLGAFLVSGFLWLIANLAANVTLSPDSYLSYTREATVGASLLPLTFLMFCLSFTGRYKKLSNRAVVGIFSPVLFLLLTTPTSLNVRSANLSDGSFAPGPAYIVLVAILAGYFTYGIYLLVSTYQKSQDSRIRQQLYYILLGTGLTVVPGVVLNGILPLFGNATAVSYGPTVVIFFATLTSVAIVKHRLLDVRLVIARSLGYALSLLMLAVIYGAVVFGIATYVFGLHFSIAVQVFLSAATGIIGITFQRFQKAFDRLTNSLFYRDAYDSQGFLDEFNKVLVSTFELLPLLRRSADVIVDNLKPSYALYGIRETATTARKIVGSAGSPMFNEADISYLRKTTPRIRTKIIVADDLDERHAELQKVLRKNNIAVLARLASSHTADGGIGYLVLGPKKSGNPYSVYDIQLIEILANQLVLAIQNSLRFEEIENFNVTLQAKVAEATRKLRNTNDKLRALDEAKDDFVSMASHQLRTPLTSIKGYTSMVLEGDAGRINATQRKLLEQSFISAQRMVYLIADLLNVSRLKTGKFVIELSPVNLAEVVQQEIGQLTETAAGRQLSLSYQMPTSFPTLMLDETKTRQVIMNFVDNAIYYTPAGGHVEVKLTETATSVELRVVDDGIGVPKSEQPHLFTKFYRAGNARKARPDGTGLGLFMARKVIVSEGGAIIYDTQEGKGSTFGFVFSKAKQPEITQN